VVGKVTAEATVKLCDCVSVIISAMIISKRDSLWVIGFIALDL
jgi:hypothetical protein